MTWQLIAISLAVSVVVLIAFVAGIDWERKGQR